MAITWIAPPVFLALAFVFSMLGLGGGLLYIPILVWLGLDFKTEAVPLGLLLNVVTSSTAVITYAREHLIRWHIALAFGVAMVGLAPVGALLNVRVPEKPLIVFLASLIAAAGVLMLTGWRPKRGEMNTRKLVILGLSAGAVLGLISGLVGLGGGVFVVPLLYVVGLAPQAAAATAALVDVGTSVSGSITHLVIHARPNWGLWIASAAAVFIGSEIGSHYMSTRLDPDQIRPVFGAVLLAVAAVLIAKDAILRGPA